MTGAHGRIVAAAALLAVADLAAYLAGRWRLERRLEDRAGGRTGSLEGTAQFDPDAEGGLAYREQGRLVLGDFATLARQAYRFRFPLPARAEVSFADGRAFHDLDLSDGRWQARHRCGADLYCGRFAALGPERWTAEWRVTGPRKDQRLSAVYLRAA